MLGVLTFFSLVSDADMMDWLQVCTGGGQKIVSRRALQGVDGYLPIT